MLQVLTIVLAIAFSYIPPQTAPGETQAPTEMSSICPIDPPENTGGGC
jgi:hypothetical protein